jgi:hypothetical protein
MIKKFFPGVKKMDLSMPLIYFFQIAAARPR